MSLQMCVHVSIQMCVPVSIQMCVHVSTQMCKVSTWALSSSVSLAREEHDAWWCGVWITVTFSPKTISNHFLANTFLISTLCVYLCVCVCMCVCVCLCFSAISINHQPLCFLGKCCEYQQHERFSSDGWVHASVEKRPTQHKLLEQAKQP